MSERRRLERLVAGALRSTIDAHGPITRKWIGSATKRVVSTLEAERALRVPESGTSSEAA